MLVAEEDGLFPTRWCVAEAAGTGRERPARDAFRTGRVMPGEPSPRDGNGSLAHLARPAGMNHAGIMAGALYAWQGARTKGSAPGLCRGRLVER